MSESRDPSTLRRVRRVRSGRAVEAPPGLDDDGVYAAYAAHGGELQGLAYRSLGDHGLAQEAVQETFVRAWRAADRFDPSVSSLRTWLFAIQRNVIIDLARRRAVRPALANGEPVEVIDDRHLDHVMTGWVVEQAMNRLRPEHRHVIIAAHVHGCTSAEIGAELGIPEGTVRSRLFYGLKALRLALEELGWRDG